MSDLDGQVVLIAGASRGIGRAAALAFAGAGARVALLARSGDAVATLAGEIGSETALAVPCDVSRAWEVRAAVDATLATFGRLDVALVNAGVIWPEAPLAEVDREAWGHAIDINLKGAFHVIRSVLPPMLEAGSGTILTLSSGAAHRPKRGWSAYSAAKAGLAMMVRQIELEYGEDGIRAIGLSPGTVATDMQREIAGAGVNEVSEIEWDEHVPAEWPARALVWLSGPAGDDHRGCEVSLRDEDVRATLGLSR